jgi:hypothetical protein
VFLSTSHLSAAERKNYFITLYGILSFLLAFKRWSNLESENLILSSSRFQILIFQVMSYPGLPTVASMQMKCEALLLA